MFFLEKSLEIGKYIHIHLPKTNGWNPKIGGLEDDWTWNQGGNMLHVSFRDCISFQSRRHKKFIIFGGMSYPTKIFGKKMKHKAILRLFRKWFLLHQFKRNGQTHTITTFLSKKTSNRRLNLNGSPKFWGEISLKKTTFDRPLHDVIKPKNLDENRDVWWLLTISQIKV